MKLTLPKGKKPLSKKYASKLRYVSDNPAVASVNRSGVVMARNPGAAVVYIQAANGIYCKVRVTVA